MSLNSTKYISLDRIHAKLNRDLGYDLSESDIIEWSGEALEGIGAITQYKETVCFVTVTNFQAELPKGLHQIIQIGRNHCGYSVSPPIPLCPCGVLEDCVETVASTTTAQEPVCLDNCGNLIEGYDIAYYRPYFDLKWEYDFGLWRSNSRLYTQCFRPIRLATDNFFQINYTNPQQACDTGTNIGTNVVSLNTNDEDRYSIINDSTLRFNFQEGQIAISYYRQLLDEATGYPLIPDDYSYTTAITKYITLRVMEKHFYAGRQGYENKVQKAEADWHFYCRQAANKALMPTGIDEMQNYIDQSLQLYPRLNAYYGFFGNMRRRIAPPSP